MSTTAPLNRLSLTLKIALASILVGIIATFTTVIIAYFLFNDVQQKNAQNHLSSLRNILENKLERQIEFLKLDSQSLAQSPGIKQLLYIKSLETIDSTIEASFDTCHQSLSEHVKQAHYHDIYLCDPNGKILYTTLEPKSVQLESTLLKVLCKETSKSRQTVVQSSDRGIERSSNDLNEPVLLAASALISGGQVVAILIIESPLSILNATLSISDPADRGNIGASTEAYLVDTSLSPRTILKKSGLTKVDTVAARNALAGNSDVSIYKNYAGTTVLGAYARLQIDGLPWALIVEQSTQEALQPIHHATWILGGLGLILIILISFLGFIFAKTFAQPLVTLKETILKVASGDESARANVTSEDEVGQLAHAVNEMIVERNAVKDRISTENKRVQTNIQDILLVVADASEGRLCVRAKRTEGILGNVADALNRMLENVSALMGQAKNASAQVQESSSEISASAQNLADGANSQTQQIAQTILEVQNLAAEAQGVSENSQEAAKAASQTRQAAEEGAKAVRDVVAYMERLQESVQANARKITQLGERSQEISGIVRSIGDISAETDVLAMNASIEAARAGEQGKGFTVVADQVRALADRTRQATIEIEKLVMGIQSETSEAVKQMERANVEVENGTRQVSSAGDSLSKIVEASVDSSTLANQISQSATQQEQRAQAMLQAIVAINQIAEDTRNRTLDFRETSDLLASLATELNKQLANFEIGTDGSSDKN